MTKEGETGSVLSLEQFKPTYKIRRNIEVTDNIHFESYIMMSNFQSVKLIYLLNNNYESYTIEQKIQSCKTRSVYVSRIKTVVLTTYTLTF